MPEPDMQWFPPGDADSWTLWEAHPPAYKRGRVIEIWHPDMHNVTSFLSLGNVRVGTDVTGMWWRPA
jgi:hypothetical protein